MAAGRIVALLTLAFIAGSAAFAGLVPLFQNPDESTHFDRILWQWDHPFEIPDAELQVRSGVRDALDTVTLTEGGALDWGKAPQGRPDYQPVGDADTPANDDRCPRLPQATCQNYQYAHPPAYYLLAAPATPILQDEAVSRHVLALRLLGVLLAAPIVPLTFVAASQWFRGNQPAAVAAAAVMAAVGPVASAAGAVNNDALVLLAAAAAVALMAIGVRQGFSWRTAALLGATVTVGLLTKAHFLALAPLAGIAVLVCPRARERVRAAAAFAATAAPGAVYWIVQLLRNKGFEPEGSEIVDAPTSGAWNDENFLSYAVEHVDLFIGRSWGLYGWATVEVPHNWKLGLSAVAALLIVVWIVQVVRRRVRFDQPAALVVALVPVALAVAALYASFGLYRETGSVRGIVGRYVYPGLPVLAIGVAASVRAATSRPSGRVQHGPGRVAVAATIVITQVVLMAGSVRVALKGLYQTTDLALLFDRAAATAPVAQARAWATACAVIWIVATVAAAALTRSLVPPSAGPRRIRSGRATPEDQSPAPLAP